MTLDGQQTEALTIVDPPLRAAWTKHDKTGLIVSGSLDDLAAPALRAYPGADFVIAARVLSTPRD